ncbi:MAG: hypothetical protein RR490_01570, partial [Niameybacter sp.]
GCNSPVQRGCSDLAKDVYALIEKAEATALELEKAWDALENRECLKQTNNAGCNGCGCNNAQPRQNGCGCR